SNPGAGPTFGDEAEHDEDGKRERRVDREAHAVGAGVLLGLAEQVGQDSAAECADLSDHSASDGGGDGPTKGNELKRRSIACAQCGEAQHEEKRRREERWGGHQAEQSSDGDEEDDGKSCDSADAISKPSTENASGATGECSQDGEASGLNLGDVKLLDVERRQKCCEADEAAEGDDVDGVESPSIFLPQTLE